MITKLTNYYKKEGILSTHFRCTHKKECMVENKDHFTEATATFVGSSYGRGVPRLLFLSLDPGDSEKDELERLPSGVRKRIEKQNIHDFPKNRHWHLTHELGTCILKRFWNKMNIDIVHSYFAHANSAKCRWNDKNRKMADKRLFKNCQGYLKEEIRILNPDILVTQGKSAEEAIKNSFEKNISKSEIDLLDLNGQNVFWLRTHHPGDYGRFYKQKRKWNLYSTRIHDWYTGR